MPGNWEKTANILLLLCAITITFFVVKRELSPEPGIRGTNAREEAEPRYHADWRTWQEYGILIGRADAPIHIVEFMDLECPFCRRFHNGLATLLDERYQDTVAVTFIHYPLEAIHEHARPAAIAAECAEAQGQFAQFIRLVLGQQDSLGHKSWQSFAAEAGIKSIDDFSLCLKDPARAVRVDGGIALAKRLKVAGTPTVVIEGWALPAPPSQAELVVAIGAFLGGQNPFSGVGAKQ